MLEAFAGGVIQVMEDIHSILPIPEEYPFTFTSSQYSHPAESQNLNMTDRQYARGHSINQT